MYNTTVVYFLSIPLIAYSGVFVVKNFLVNYRASENGLKNISVILLMIAAIVCATSAAADAWCIEGLMDELQHNVNAGDDYRRIMEKYIADFTRESTICIVLSYIMFIAAQIIYRSIKQEILKNMNKPIERWDWSKIRR